MPLASENQRWRGATLRGSRRGIFNLAPTRGSIGLAQARQPDVGWRRKSPQVACHALAPPWTVLPRPAGAFFHCERPGPQSSHGFTAGAFRLAMAAPSASRVKRLRCINFNFVARLFAPLGEALRCCAFVLALLLHRGLARNHGELRRRALERLPGLRATVQVGSHYLVDQRPRRVVRRDHPMQ